MNLVLASTSRYRRSLLERLGLPFTTVAPEVDEARHPGETPRALALRLSRAKAEAVAARHERAVIIGSDQVAVLGNRILGKPGNRARNIEQLTAASGNRVDFLTGLCVLNTHDGRIDVDVVPVAVHFRRLSEAEIEAYVRREQAFDCAGGFRCESLGPILFERQHGDDPTALQGLPLIRLARLLAAHGIDPLAPP